MGLFSILFGDKDFPTFTDCETVNEAVVCLKEEMTGDDFHILSSCKKKDLMVLTKVLGTYIIRVFGLENNDKLLDDALKRHDIQRRAEDVSYVIIVKLWEDIK